MVDKPAPVGSSKAREPDARRHRLTDRRAVPRSLTVLGGACLVLLTACAPTLPARPPIAEPPARPASEEPAVRLTPIERAARMDGTVLQEQPSAKPASEEPAARPTPAERAAKRDGIVPQGQPTPRPSSTAPAGGDYQGGYPRLGQAPKARADGTLQSFPVLDTGPYLANSNVHNLTWPNNSGRPLAIYKAYLWTGVDKGASADVHIEARRASDNSFIGILQWDHYADPTLPQHGQQFDYPSPMILDPGDAITIMHFANGFAPGWHAHHLLILWVK